MKKELVARPPMMAAASVCIDMRKGELTRQYIIEKSAPVFNKRGYGSASLADLMAATGLEKGGIYRHFTSKEALACAAFEYAFQTADVSKFAPVRQLSGGLEKIQQLIKNFAEIRSPIAGGCPVYNTAVEQDDGNPALKKCALKAYQTWLREITGFFDEAKKEGSIDKQVDSERMATFVLTSVEGALIARNLTKDAAVLAGVCAELQSYVESKRTASR